MTDIAQGAGALHTLYRPTEWEHIVGNEAQVKRLRTDIEERASQCYLLSSPTAGVGKTTLARIAAREVGADGIDLIEVPAALYTGVEDMRSIVDGITTNSMLGGNKALIVDECHRLSGNAWDAILKATEEPPPHVFWFFCTTNATKVPNTIKTRCTHIQLKPLKDGEVKRLVEEIAALENIGLAPEILRMVVDASYGSGRQALQNLAAVRTVRNRTEAAEVLNTVADNDAVIKLIRAISHSQMSWPKAMALVKAVEDENPEGIRIVAANYLGKALRGAKDDETAIFFLGMLDAFAEPYRDSEGMASLIRSLGRAFFSVQR